jgi:hypothetical protein
VVAPEVVVVEDVGPVRVCLPEAPADLYLAWVSFLLGADRRINASGIVCKEAAERGFVVGPAAVLVRELVLAPLVTSVGRAMRSGHLRLAPAVVGAPRQLLAAADYLERWGMWLVEDGVLGRVGVRLPDPGVAALRRSVIRAIQLQAATPA